MIGQSISHYKILEKLGEGGMGVVYKAHDLKLDRTVALKFLPHHLTANEAEQARFLQEARAASALNHANICGIHSIGEQKDPATSEEQRFIDMEFVDGSTLRKKFESAPLRVSEAVGYAIQIGEALHEAHTKGIVHRDIKADNVMVNSKNQIKVMDFGLAKLKGSLKLTRTSSTVGTLAYMAPEQIQGGEVDARSDIFSFGVLLFEMLTGHFPFRGEHEAAILYSIVNEDPESVLKSRPECSAELDRIINRALEKDPADRFQHADDMVSELRRVQKQSAKVSRSSLTNIPISAPSPAKTNQETPAMRSQGLSFPRYGYLVVAILALIAVATAYYFFFLNQAKPFDSLAVLPFVNVSADPNTEYLSDGITESIINSLTQIPGLRVIPRSTVFRFKGKDIDPQEVGAKLKVRAVLTGRIVQRGDDLNVQLDLIDIDRQSQIYGNQYHHKAVDIISMQEEIVGDVLKPLGVTLSGEERKTVNKRYTENVEAYKFYLQGRFYWNKRKASEILKAIGFFNQAIALDPTYALAYVGLADCYAILEQYAGLPGKETYPKAISAATRALELDNTLAEAHTTVAFASYAMWNWDKAEQEFKTAFSLNPNYPTAYHWYSILLHSLGRHEEASKAIKRAQELDPLSPVIGLNVAIAYAFEGNYEKAIQGMDAVLAIDSTFSLAYSRKTVPYLKIGKKQESYIAASKGVEVSGRSAEAVSFLGYCSALIGKRDEALKIVKELEQRYAVQTSSGYSIARVYAGLGDPDGIFKWLHLDLENHSGSLIWLTQDSEWDPYKSDPRFLDLLDKIGLKK
jgi:serine/threonine-protein kinase